MGRNDYYFKAVIIALGVFLPLFFLIKMPKREVGEARVEALKHRVYYGGSVRMSESLALFDQRDLFLPQTPTMPEGSRGLSSEFNVLEEAVKLPIAWDNLEEAEPGDQEERANFVAVLEPQTPRDVIERIYGNDGGIGQDKRTVNAQRCVSVRRVYPGFLNAYQCEGIEGEEEQQEGQLALIVQEDAIAFGPPLIVNRLADDASQEVVNARVREVFRSASKDDGYYFVEIQ